MKHPTLSLLSSKDSGKKQNNTLPVPHTLLTIIQEPPGKMQFQAWRRLFPTNGATSLRNSSLAWTSTSQSIKTSINTLNCHEEATARFTRALHSFYGDDATGKVIEMDLDITADDFVLLAHPPGKPPIPYVYWNYGVTPREEYDKAKMNGKLRDLPFNHNPKFAAEIEPSLQAGIEGLAIASVSFFESWRAYE
jgi:hypothetical protein